ncbi:MAG TPA: type II secretion system protein [Phycisphaerae bacterium]|nr:type II secretion system protein [Phycisphaerae bacterium]
MHSHAYRVIRQRAPRAGFTLVELLVVVACISMLTAMLLPALGSARERAKETCCAGRLQQWGLAFACYANENNAVWPHCDGLDREDPDPNDPDRCPPNAPPWQLANWHGWVDMLPPLMGFEGWRYCRPREHPDQTTFYQCPSGELCPDSAYDYNPRRNGYFSYAMNSCLELDEACWAPPDEIGYPMPSFLDTAKIVRPSGVVLLFDQLLDTRKAYGGDFEDGGAGKHCGSYPIYFAARHRRGVGKLGGNLLFADGHVAWQPTVWKPEWGEWEVYQQQSPPRNDPNWFPYPVWGEE